MHRPPLKPFFASLLGLAAAVVLTIGLAAAAPGNARETPLSPDGEAYEVNLDGSGGLWISDYLANEIRQIHPATGAYTVYQGLPGATDARTDAAGAVWWTNTGGGNTLGRLLPAAGTVTTWTLGTAGIPWGTALDAAGLVWVTDIDTAQLHRFAPLTSDLCTFSLPEQTSSDYVVAGAGGIWLGDSDGDRILRLAPGGALTVWQLPTGAYPQGLALSAEGHLWWADLGLARLSRLDPVSNTVTSYSLPVGSGPEMVSLAGGKVWYTEFYSGTLGVLNPAAVIGESAVVISTTQALVPECENLGPGTTTSVVTSTGMLDWDTALYPTLVNAGGWRVYDLPAGSAPWGISAGDALVWAVDQGRQQLLSMSLLEPPALEVAKAAEPALLPAASGDVTFTFTVTNVTPTQAVTITGLSDSVYGTLTGEAGCQTGTVLAPGQTCSFSITRPVHASASGADHVNVFTALAEDQAQVQASATATATVTFTSAWQHHVYLPYLSR